MCVCVWGGGGGSNKDFFSYFSFDVFIISKTKSNMCYTLYTLSCRLQMFSVSASLTFFHRVH